GLKKEEVRVEIEEDRVLQISGERNVEKEEKNDTWHRVERSSGKFMRRFRLPENAKMDQVKAAMENGVLTVTVPKEEVKKPDVKSIEITG
uniref:Class I heat shock protein n=2 Tax=Nicotiana sylvestris TaxID=4096 RepID=A0A1U7Y675_NICSY